MGNKNLSCKISWGILLVLAALIVLMSSVVVWLGDDVDYRYVIHDYVWLSYGNINSISDLMQSQVMHWQNTNGRAVAHTLVQIFCGVTPEWVFGLCNGLVYMCYVWLIARLSSGRRPMRHPMVIGSVAVLIPLVFITKMMPSCQVGFVWMFTLNMLWLWLFLNHYHAGVISSVLISVLGFMAGNGQEGLTVGLSASLGLWWLSKRARVGLHRNVWLVCYWLGTLSSCLSPGTMSRANGLVIPFDESIIYMLLSLRAFYILVAVMIWMRVRHGVNLMQMWKHAPLYINTIVVLLLFNMVIGVYSNRQLFGIELMSIIVTLRLLPRHAFNKAWLMIFTIASILISVHQIGCALSVRRQYQDIEKEYSRSKTGVVYYNRTLGSSNPFDREMRIYEEIIGYGYHDTSRTLAKIMKERWPDHPYLKIFSRELNNITTLGDTIIEYSPHHYMVVVADKFGSYQVHGKSEIFPWIEDELLELEACEKYACSYKLLDGKTVKIFNVVPWKPFYSIEGITVRESQMKNNDK